MRLLWSVAALIAVANGQCLSENDVASKLAKGSKTKLYSGEQEFTLSLLEQVNRVSSTENVFFSSYSVFHALLLAYFGSTGNTEQSLKKVLKLDWSESKFDVMQAYRLEKNMRIKRAKNSSVDFRSADRLYFDKTVRVKDCITDLFMDEVQTLDFAHKPEESAQVVNKWIESATSGQIKDILSPGDLADGTKAVLANAAYFKGSWASQFEPDYTENEIFYTPTNQTFVPMMNKKGNFNHGRLLKICSKDGKYNGFLFLLPATSEILGAHVLELPYLGEGTEISFFAFLPPFSVPNGLDNLLSKLNLSTFEGAINDVSAREVEVKLPKFAFEKTLKLVPLLTQMGIGDVFQSTAKFNAFSDDQILFDDATHKAKIEVNEEGSTAAAATVLFSFRSARPVDPAQFHCNHPFLFVIYDHRAKSILFTGIYRGPEL